MLRDVIKDITPPILKRSFRKIFARGQGYYSGPYKSWGHANQYASGYTDVDIIETVRKSSLALKTNSAAFVRDGFILDSPEYPHPLLATILKLKIEIGSNLNILDFGGGLGSTFYALKQYCPQAIPAHWCIVEQPAFVEIGCNEFKDDTLLFYESIKEIEGSIDLAILSGVLQYLKEPYHCLEQIVDRAVPFILIDRTLFSAKNAAEQLLVEHVPKHIYPQSYPCWLFNYSQILRCLMTDYEVLDEFDGLEGKFHSGKISLHSRGVFLRRKGV